ncbi:16S rRNA (guanine(527)-N(7))-methyltransferase RsmG [Alicyclobacillus sp.]|uniref:16S rRNA (guanine(527)-N(7))-methyltransferase RsmG n=1 Tax=Alicyclobacillus sp. TaxID=61169 RepID=UPI0025B7D07D|nr:16S rRNA (guanine(527)-N(7))-methyltransferase RsmG [Alicyclobacillus sp.]MCL6516005.1 16S rRNA (guanine(527)-N(7))-methyltransferase RsmG [Alicyclobacillus sp.]
MVDLGSAEALIARHREAFEEYRRRLVAWNEQVNLTSITDEEEVFIKHFVDSVAVVALREWRGLSDGAVILDVGTGAGFPGLPLAICHPRLRFVLVDALQKRVRFLQEMVEALRLNHVLVMHGRAEDLVRADGMRAGFDACVSRAVASLPVLLELTMPFVRPGGFTLAWKGPGVYDELDAGSRAAGILGGRIQRVDAYDLPGGAGGRTLVVVEQRRPAPERYPRKAGVPQRKPLA